MDNATIKLTRTNSCTSPDLRGRAYQEAIVKLCLHLPEASGKPKRCCFTNIILFKSVTALDSRSAMASVKALHIAEVINEILHHTSSVSDLYHCALVNHQWHDEVLPYLWRTSPPLETLVKLDSDGALPKYLRYIRCQTIEAAHPELSLRSRELLSTGVLRLMRTVELVIGQDWSLHPPYKLEQVLQPTVRILHLDEDSYENTVFDDIEVSL